MEGSKPSSVSPTDAPKDPASPGHRRLAVVVSHPTQYYSPWFRWLASQTALDLRVFYLWKFGVSAQRDPEFGTTFEWDVDLLSGYASEFVPNSAGDPGAGHFWGFNNPLLPARLAAWRPDALLLFGYRWASHLRAILWARWRRVPIVFRGDSHFLGRHAPSGPSAWLLRWIFGRFSAFAYVGSANRDYFAALGVPDEKLFFAPHSVDGSLFDPGRPETAASAAALRSRMGLAPGVRVVLFAGKFVPAKQPRELLEAFLELDLPGTALIFVGDGEERASLEARAGSTSGRRGAAVRFLPFANQSEMPARYLAADVFALPSRGSYETWGLAVNEAMHMGLPCLVSDRVGCQRDLVTDGETGWVFRSTDRTHLRDRLEAALSADLSVIKPRVAARIAGYTYRQATDGLLAALSSLDGGFAAS
jgi:glycosyltransferase involved in cell wall biosynthesis